MPGAINVETGADGLRVVTLSNPDKKNALDDEMLTALLDAIEEASGVRGLLIRGAGDAFSAGYDVSQLAAASPDDSSLPDDGVMGALEALEAAPFPTVAFVRGVAFGAGCDLACACDFRVGDSTAAFCMPPARLGVVYALPGIRRLASVVGAQMARRMLLTGATVESSEAYEKGLLDDSGDEAAARELCASLVKMAPQAVEGLKLGLSSLRNADAFASRRDLFDSMRVKAFQSQDAKEGLAALKEKRPPKFTGR